MNVKYLLHKSRIQEVSALLFPHGREIDWEMRSINGVTEELSLTATDLGLHEAVLAVCTFTSDYQRRRVESALRSREGELRRQAKRNMLLTKIKAREKYYERGLPVR